MIVSSGFVSVAMTSSQLNRLTKRFSERDLIKAALVLVALALFAVPFATNLWAVWISAIVFGIGLGIIDPVRIIVFTSLVPGKCRAAIIALDETFVILGMVVGPMMMGAIFSFWSLNAVFNAGAILAVGTFVLMLVMLRKNR